MSLATFRKERLNESTVVKLQTQPPSVFDGSIYLSNQLIRDFGAAERYRVLRAQLERANRQTHRYRAIAVTSALSGEGKSTIAVNLARMLSAHPLGRTLLIDGDLRRPTLHSFFRVSRGPGVSDVLTGRVSIYESLVSITPWLDLLPAGTPGSDPSELMERPAFADLLNFARLEYRYTIIDSPPVAICAEPIAISSLADTSLFVVRGWHTHRAVIKDAIELIGRSKILGVVMNETNEPGNHYRHHGGYWNPSERP